MLVKDVMDSSFIFNCTQHTRVLSSASFTLSVPLTRPHSMAPQTPHPNAKTEGENLVGQYRQIFLRLGIHSIILERIKILMKWFYWKESYHLFQLLPVNRNSISEADDLINWISRYVSSYYICSFWWIHVIFFE